MEFIDPEISEYFKLACPPRLEKMWDKMGLDQMSRQKELLALKTEIISLISQFTENQEKQMAEIIKQIEQIHEQHRNKMIAFGIPQKDIDEAIPEIQPINLLQQLNGSKQSYENFNIICQERVQKLENLIRIANELFDHLCVPAEKRGEYGQLGNEDFSQDRLTRLKEKIKLLQKEKGERESSMKEICNEIKEVTKELGECLTPEEKEILNSNIITSEVLNGATNILQRLLDLKEKKIKDLSKFAVEITHLWDILEVPNKERRKFILSNEDVSDEVMRRCQEEINRLIAERDAKLPLLLKQQMEEAEMLWNKLHIPKSYRLVIDPSISKGQKAMDQFVMLEKEILKLKQKYYKAAPIISTIESIEEIEKDYANAVKSSDPKRLTSRKKEDAQALVAEERARRRYKQVLPKLTRKLISQLEDWKNENGADFEWDGLPYIEKLKDEMEKDLKVSSMSMRPVRKTPRSIKNKGATIR